jgi:uncharacterized membrane protein YidH (DUF202 family)
MTLDKPFDKGLQPERTLLAWRRTALALGVGSAVGARLALPVLGAAAVVVGVLGSAVALGAYVLAAGRYRRHHEALAAGEEELPGGGLALAGFAAVAGVLALGGLGYVLLLAGARP